MNVNVTQNMDEMNENTGKGLYLGAAFAFVFDGRGRMLLLKEHESRRKYMWDLPGGTLCDGESPVEGLHREVMEETGLEIELMTSTCWLKQDWHESGRAILVSFYLARGGERKVRLSEEHIDYRWVTRQEFTDEGLTVSAEREIVDDCFARYRGCTAAYA